MTLHIGVDVDDVLFPWYEKAHAACVAAGITNGVEPTSWSPFNEYGIEADVWYTVLERATVAGELYVGPPYAGAIGALHALAGAGHAIHIVTARGFFSNGDVIKQQTVEWLRAWNVPHESLVFTRDKTRILVDRFVDDSARNVAALTAAGIRTWMVNRPHNADADHDLRVDHVAEFAASVLNEEAA